MIPERAPAAALRRAFDERFATAIESPQEQMERLVLAHCAGARIALRLGEIAGVHASPPLARVPGGGAGLLGLTAISGRVVAVFDLAVFLGGGATPQDDALVVVAAAADRVGLLVTGAIAHADLGLAEIEAAMDGARPYVRTVARVHGALVPIVDVPGVIEAIGTRTGEAR